VSNEVTTVCTMQGYKPTVRTEVSVGVCILPQCILTRTIRMFINEVTEDSKAVWGMMNNRDAYILLWST
jgi:hypothetical protein